MQQAARVLATSVISTTNKKIRKLSGFTLEDTKSTNDNQSRHISADSLFIVELKILALAALLPQGTVDTC